MVISYHGGEFFKVSFGEMTLAFNPISKDSKLKGVRFGADIALITLNHPDFTGAEAVAYGERQPFIISGPGEYEVKGIRVRGFSSVSSYGGEGRTNTIYLVTLEGMNLCFLGALGSKKLSAEAREALDEIDVLFVPIGGEGVLDASEAHELAVELEPAIIIPMHYRDDGSLGVKNSLGAFLREEGGKVEKPLEKLTIKKKDLEGKEGEVVVLAA